jgi:hypothetical protein
MKTFLYNFLTVVFSVFTLTSFGQETTCVDYRFYYSDIQGGTTSIYEVELADGQANLNLLKEVPFGAHIAYNEANNLLYVIQGNNGAIRTLDVSVVDGAISDPLMPELPLSGVINATFNSDNKLLIAAESTDRVYIVDENTGALSLLVDEFTPISGGDIAFNANHELLLATRAGGGKLFKVATFNPVTLEFPSTFQIGEVPSLVTGIAALEDGNFVLSANGANEFVVYNQDGSGPIEGESYLAPFTLGNGDMAAGCQESQPVESCQNYPIYLAASNQGGKLFEVVLDDDNNSAQLTELRSGLGGFHLALNGETGELYIVKGSGEVAVYNPSTDALSEFSNIAMGDMNINSTYAAVYTDDNILLVGSANQGKVYEVNPLTGEASNPVDAPVNGGDLIQTNDGNVWLINRGQNRFYNLSDGVSTFDVEFDEIYGAAVLESGLILIGDAGSELKVVDPSIPGSIEQVYDLGLNVTAGDLAAGCVDGGDIVVPEPGNCYASEIIEFSQGKQINGSSSIAAARSDADNAIGEPQRDETINFVCVGYPNEENPESGFITLGFEGAVPNLEGDDIEVVETTFGSNGCASYPEFADVYVSQNGVDFFFAGEVCRFEPFIEIDDAGQGFEYITQVKIRNSVNSTTPDGFDLDGVVALHNCDSEPIEVDPFCTNETIYLEENLENQPAFRLTSMGMYQGCDGQLGRRWRIRNYSGSAAEIYYDIYGTPGQQGPFQLEDGESVFFTDAFFGPDENSAGTMRIFVDGQQVNVKARNPQVNDLSLCLPEGCPDTDNLEQADQPVALLEAYPNPSSGPTVVEFTTNRDERTTVELSDMNGRIIQTLYNQDAQAGSTYRIDFNGLNLPNGIYIVRLTTPTGIVISKIMMNK